MRVNRYECGMTNAPTEYQSPTMHQDTDGGYVAYEDYAALEQRLIESERYGRQTDITIDNLEMQLNAEREAKMALAAENAEMKTKGRVLLGEACAVYAKLNKLIDPAIGDFVDGQTLHEFQFVLDCETPATDAFLAEVRAQGVEQLASVAGNEYQRYKSVNDRAGARKWKSIVILCTDFSAQLRKGVQS